MENRIEEIKKEISESSIADTQSMEAFRIRYLGKKGVLTSLFGEMKNIAVEDRKEFGKIVNELKLLAEEKLTSAQEKFGSDKKDKNQGMDLSLPGFPFPKGSRHPVNLVREELYTIFGRIGFTVAEGPEIEDDWHNFSALNFPENHPARDMQDTFFIEHKSGTDSIALRTHTSSVQVRVMENQKPPIRVLAPGRVYRNEAISARAHCFFHQVEGLYIDENVSFADLKQTLLYFAQQLFGNDANIRLRPSYFPFTEPSAEMDVSCSICKGKGCNVCKYTGWLEILGCGMVDPNVLINCNIDPEKFSGYAFGIGLERIAMLRYDVKDLRLFSENDVRFLKQFV